MSKRPYKSHVKTEEENKLNKLMGVNIKEARKKAKLTQMNLAKHLGVSFQAIGKYEKGKNAMNPIKLLKTSIATKTPITHFYFGKEMIKRAEQYVVEKKIIELPSQVEPLSNNSDVILAPSNLTELN